MGMSKRDDFGCFIHHGADTAAIALASQPHLVIWVDPCAGLARLHLDEAQRWLLALPVCGVY